MALKDVAKQSVHMHLKFGVELMSLIDVCRKALKSSGLQSVNFAFQFAPCGSCLYACCPGYWSEHYYSRQHAILMEVVVKHYRIKQYPKYKLAKNILFVWSLVQKELFLLKEHHFICLIFIHFNTFSKPTCQYKKAKKKKKAPNTSRKYLWCFSSQQSRLYMTNQSQRCYQWC